MADLRRRFYTHAPVRCVACEKETSSPIGRRDKREFPQKDQRPGVKQVPPLQCSLAHPDLSGRSFGRNVWRAVDRGAAAAGCEASFRWTPGAAVSTQAGSSSSSALAASACVRPGARPSWMQGPGDRRHHGSAEPSTEIYGLFQKLIEEADKRRPDLAVVIDAPAFNWRVARQMRKRGIPVVYYVCPQFWAWRQGRVRLLRKYVNKALVIFPSKSGSIGIAV